MRYVYISLLFLLASPALMAQQVVYFDQYWKPTTDKTKAVYYRQTHPQKGGTHVKDYYLSGQLQMEGFVISLDPFVQQGMSTYYFPNGQVSKRAWYSNEGKTEKVADVYEEDGKAVIKKGNGSYQHFDPKSGRTDFFTFQDSLLVSAYAVRSQTNDTVYRKVDQLAEPKEGMKAFYQNYLSRIKYPFMPRMKGVEKQIYIRFLVDTIGQLTEFESMDPSGYRFDAKTIRFLSKAPAWNPARLNSQPVKTEYILPVRFVLD